MSRAGWLLGLLLLFAAPLSFAQRARLGGAGRITGRVVNVVTGQPLAGIDVSISSTEQRDLVTETTSGPDGGFGFDNVVKGKYSLLAQGRGFSEQAYQQHAPYSTAVAVGPGLVSEDLVFELVPDGSISGFVLDDENEAVRSGDVLLFSRDGATGKTELTARGTLEGQGHYHFGHLLPGTYLVAVSAQPWFATDPAGARISPQLTLDGETTPDQNTEAAFSSTPDPSLDVAYRVTFYADAVEAESATPIRLRAGERASADITLRAVPSVHLTVRNASNDPNQPGSAAVQQRVSDRALVPIQARMQPGPQGTLKLAGIAPGHVVINVRTHAGKEWKNQTRELDLSTDTEIDAAENSSGAVYIRGTVQNPQHSIFPPGTYIRFFSRESHEAFGGPVSDKGKFEIIQSLSSVSNFGIAVIHSPSSIVEKISARGASVVGRTVTLPHSGIVELSVTLSQGAGRIDGTVLRDGKGLSQAMVVLVPQSWEGNVDLFRRDQSDSDGTFSLYQVLPGRYTVVAIENGWDLDWQNPDVLRPYLDHGDLIEVTGSRTYRVSVVAQGGHGSATTQAQTQN